MRCARFSVEDSLPPLARDNVSPPRPGGNLAVISAGTPAPCKRAPNATYCSASYGLVHGLGFGNRAAGVRMCQGCERAGGQQHGFGGGGGPRIEEGRARSTRPNPAEGREHLRRREVAGRPPRPPH